MLILIVKKISLSNDSFRTWHIIFIVCGTFLIGVVVLSCLFKCRIPRTKSEIEANNKRRALLKNFRIKLKNLKAADLDDMDYRSGNGTTFYWLLQEKPVDKRPM